jgi:hypothetical protein
MKNDFKVGWIYLVQPVQLQNTNIYKIGRTCDLETRLRTYGGLKTLILSMRVSNVVETETQLIKLLCTSCKLHRMDIGNEYFEFEDLKTCINLIYQVTHVTNNEVKGTTDVSDIIEDNVRAFWDTISKSGRISTEDLVKHYLDFCTSQGIHLDYSKIETHLLQSIKKKFGVRVSSVHLNGMNTKEIVFDLYEPDEFFGFFTECHDAKPLSFNSLYKVYKEYKITNALLYHSKTEFRKRLTYFLRLNRINAYKLLEANELHGYAFNEPRTCSTKFDNKKYNPVGVWLKEQFDYTGSRNDNIAVEELYTSFKRDTGSEITKNKFGRFMTLLGYKSEALDGIKRSYLGLKRHIHLDTLDM